MMFVSGTDSGVAFPVQPVDREREGLLGPVSRIVAKTGPTMTIKTFDRAGILIEAENRRTPPSDQPEVGDSVEKLVYTHDSKGNRTGEMIVERDGEKYPSRRYAYDGAGNTIAEAAYHMCGTFSSLHIYTHDVHGRVQEDLAYQYRFIVRHVYRHDDRGRTVKELLYRNGTLQSTVESAYDQGGRLAEERAYLPDGALSRKAMYQYDDRGNRTGEEVIHPTHTSLNSKEVSAYEYDSTGNWIRRTTRRLIIPVDDDGMPLSEPIEITERSMTYH